MNQTLSFSRWLTASRLVATSIVWLREYTWTLGHLRHDAVSLVDHLRDQPGNRWASCFENSYLLIVALLAMLHPGKIPVISGHNHAALLNVQCSLFDCVLSDKRLGWNDPQLVVSTPHQMTTSMIAFDDIASDTFIKLLTLGSTRQPKQIVKPVISLDQEANILATHFADRLLGCRSVALVALQHLHGLTFRIFLPIAFDLPLHATMF